MARHSFGLTAADWAFTVAIDGLTPQLAASATFTLWNQASSGTQYTDLALDSGGLEPITFVTASDGSDGYIAGTVEEFFGPDGIRDMWIDGGAGGRLHIVATDLGNDVNDHETRIEALENQVANLLDLCALMMVMNIEVTGTYPARPGNAGSRIVGWVGDDTPSAGTGGLVTGDLYFDTAP
jgi:hypothetical protein